LITLAVTVASAVSFSLFIPVVAADDLTDRRAEVKQAIAKTRNDLSESSHALTAAGVAVARTQAQLDVAQAKLAKTQRELVVARARDAKMAAKLKRARIELAAAKAAVKAGQAELDAQQAMAGQLVRDQYQQQSNLLPVALLVGSKSTEDLQTRLQWSTTLFDTAQAEIDELTAIQIKLEAAKARRATLEVQIAADRREAAANLKTRQALEARAAAEKASVARLLQQRRATQRAAAQDVAADKARYAKLARERASVEQRIAARIAKARAEAAAQRAAARRAAAQARQAAKAAKRAGKSTKAHRSAARNHKSSNRSSGGSNAGHGFSYPVSGPITSAYGQRFHPVLRYWKLHDGTDFGAGCGAPIRAPHSGRVAERYYNSGYGNRLMIDHGYIGGNYVTTGYNHAIRYTVSVGEHVSKGEVIGYVGTTGFSTGCHLHLMVWLNGRVVNPMRWF
jgi:murein DD-endopeptidase MepM/ murein hydrolase activator NlpD